MKILLQLSFLLLNFSLFSESPILGEIIASPFNHYQIIEKIGSGAFGKVYQAHDEQQELYALKWYKSQKHLKGLSLLYADAKREFILGQILNHPNIIKSIEHFTKENDAYVVLEYVKGKTLVKISKNTFSLEDGKRMCLDLIDALQYALKLNFIFLDLYENNLMITPSAHIKLIDLSSFVSLSDIQKLIKSKKNKAEFHRLSEEEKERFTLLKTVHPELQAKTVFPTMIKNFDRTVAMLCRILDNSQIDRKFRLKIKEAIQKLNWRAQEDLDEDKPINLDLYFDQLSRLIHSSI